MSIEDNVTMSRLAPYSLGGALQLKKRWSAALRWIERVHCRCASPAQLVETLSGGNQQKIALARLLHHDANILLFDEPTRGIDVGTKSEIYRVIGELAAAGRTIVMSSSDLPELLNVCDRVGVMYRGRLVEVRAASQWNATDVLRFATGAEAGRT
jgi:ribose transport system ATP-binding protein